MSSVDLVTAERSSTPIVTEPNSPGRNRGRFTASEIRLVFGRRRNQALLAVLALLPVVIGIAVRVNESGAQRGDGPTFVSQLTGNGVFLLFTALTVALPVFFPLVIGIIGADTVAGEAGAGTLRYLVTVPVGRLRLLVAKWLGALTFSVAATVLMAVTGLVAGAALFGLGPVTLISGDQVSLGNALLRVLAVIGYVIVCLAGLTTVGLFVSTLTEVPIAAMAATIGLAIASTIIDNVPQLDVVHPYLLTHHWLDFAALLRAPVDTATLTSGLLTQLAYTALFGSLAWAKFAGSDITS